MTLVSLPNTVCLLEALTWIADQKKKLWDHLHVPKLPKTPHHIMCILSLGNRCFWQVSRFLMDEHAGMRVCVCVACTYKHIQAHSASRVNLHLQCSQVACHRTPTWPWWGHAAPCSPPGSQTRSLTSVCMFNTKYICLRTRHMTVLLDRGAPRVSIYRVSVSAYVYVMSVILAHVWYSGQIYTVCIVC
jgi:hypothetical protein